MKRLIAIVLALACCTAAAEEKPYTAWLMVMWVDSDVSRPYIPIRAYRDYEVCIDTVPAMRLSLQLPVGAKVDCIDKPMVAKH